MRREELKRICQTSANREELLERLINANSCNTVAEVGVYKGDLAERLLQSCPTIERYTLIDSWRNIEAWNKPYNQSNESFESIYQEAMARLDFTREKVQVLRGKTQEVINDVENDSIDLIYIDGDHTLRGITIDLIQWWEKLKGNGIMVGDDFYPSMKRRSLKYEPTLVFPYAVYFAEAVDIKIYALPFNQFLLDKSHKGFEFIDFTGRYSQREMKPLIQEVIQAQTHSLGVLKKFLKRIKAVMG